MNRGFTLTEAMIVVAIVGIIAAVVLPGFFGDKNATASISSGIGGIVETRCIEGYKFVITNGKANQLMDEFAHGVRCTTL